MYDFKKIEPEILNYWDKHKIYQKLKKKGKKKFYFLDGPPYTSGRIHIGQAWNKSLKDMVLRYKRMNNFLVWDRAGYDMHGLPTAHKVQEKFNIKHKEEIPGFGIQRFVEECKKLSIENMNLMNQDFKRLGVWMDFDNPYMSIENSFIEGTWWLVKQAHLNKRLYEGEKVMHWCKSCSTSLAKHELEYKNVQDESIFVKFKVKNTKNEFLIIWTTTPWTIPFNLAVMANPNIDYIKAKVDKEIWILAKSLAEQLINKLLKKQYKIIETFKGKKLENLHYEHPFNDIIDYPKIKADIYKVILSEEYVDISSGSGLVHAAPGCGPEDFEVCYKYKILPFNNLDEKGTFPKEMGKFAGLIAKDDDSQFTEELRQKNVLITKTSVKHEYAHCWRCHNPIIFRLTKQWFFKVEDLKEEMRKLNKKVFWQPDWAGNRWFDSWLENLRDNSITRQYYWGAPAPIWKCELCDDYTIIGSIDELKKLSGKTPEDLHRPWIDELTIKCKCGGIQKRTPDVLDVWIDAGTTSWTCLDYPQKIDLFKKFWPADFILEGKDQIRGWFNLLLIASMVAMRKHSYKAVYMHGFVQDAEGRKMSKSLGNKIYPSEIIEQYGADTLRYYMISGANPGLDINYNFQDIKVRFRNLTVFYNLVNYLLSYPIITKIDSKNLDLEELYILSKLNSTIKLVTEAFEQYKLNEIPILIENLFLEVSRVYVQLVRDKIENEPKKVVPVLYKVLFDTLKLFSVICPFITENLYQQLKIKYKLKEESIHAYSWPKYNQKLINKKLEENFEKIKIIIQDILAEREKVKLGIRWPLNSAVITTKNSTSLKQFIDIIKTQTNVKEIILKEGEHNIALDTKLTPILESEGFSRELTRRIQDLRKKSKLNKNNKIELCILTDDLNLLERFKSEIQKKTGAISINISTKFDKLYTYKDKVDIKNKHFELGFNLK